MMKKLHVLCAAMHKAFRPPNNSTYIVATDKNIEFTQDLYQYSFHCRVYPTFTQTQVVVKNNRCINYVSMISVKIDFTGWYNNGMKHEWDL